MSESVVSKRSGSSWREDVSGGLEREGSIDWLLGEVGDKSSVFDLTTINDESEDEEGIHEKLEIDSLRVLDSLTSLGISPTEKDEISKVGIALRSVEGGYRIIFDNILLTMECDGSPTYFLTRRLLIVILIIEKQFSLINVFC
jgi:hypothetical protein